MADKVSVSLNMSVETAARFGAITDSLRFTNEQALIYLLDLHDKMKPEREGFPGKRPLESHLHTCVRPEIKSKFRQLAIEYGLNGDQMLSVLIDIHDQCPGCAASQLAWSAGMDAARTKRPGSAAITETKSAAATTGKSGDAIDRLEAALDMICDAFLSVASDGTETASLREQLAQSQAETRKAKAAYQRTLQAIATQLQDHT